MDVVENKCRQTDAIPRPIPSHRHELQSGCKGVAHPFFRKKSAGFALQTGENNRRTGRRWAADHHPEPGI